MNAGKGVRYALPQLLNAGEGEAEIFYRVDNVYRNPKIVVESGGKTLCSKKRPVLAPGEMEKVTLNLASVTGDVTLRLET